VTFNGGNRINTRITEDRLRRAFRRAISQEQEEPAAEAAAA